jgi:DNA-binding transcriptional ArsR family regulator
MKHLDVLRQAALVLTREEGRQRINSLNAVPIRMIYERWVSGFEGNWASTLLRVKEAAERAASARSPAPPAAKTTKDTPTKQKRKARSRS